MSDNIIRATGKVAEVRYVLADLTESVQIIAERHGITGQALELLGDACVASVFLSAGLKSAGSVSFEANFSEGLISSVVAESTPMGLIRAKIRHDEVLQSQGKDLNLTEGLLRVRKLNEYAKLMSEGIVEMPSIQLGKSLSVYLLNSEQTKNAVAIETKLDPHNPAKILYAAGYLVEAFPKIDDKTILIQEQVVLNLAPFGDFFADKEFQLHALLDQLAGPFEYEVHREVEVKPYCPCSKERMLNSMAALQLQDLEELAEVPEVLELHCDFCRSRYEISNPELLELIQSKKEV